MKKQILIIALTLTAVCAQFTSCQKESVPPVLPPEDEEELDPYVAPDSIHDLVGYFSAVQEVFLIDPDYLESVLEFTGALPATDGRFHVTYVNDDGVVKEFFFFLQLVPAPDLYFFADELAKNEPVLESKDPDGKWKLYKNAICPEKPNIKAETSDCETVNNDKDGAKSRKTVNGAYKRCIYNANENNLCREVMGKIGTTSYYENLNCKGKVIKTEDFNAFKCG